MTIDDKKPALRGMQLKMIRDGMSRANQKFMAGGRPNPRYKPITLRRSPPPKEKS